MKTPNLTQHSFSYSNFVSDPHRSAFSKFYFMLQCYCILVSCVCIMDYNSELYGFETTSVYLTYKSGYQLRIKGYLNDIFQIIDMQINDCRLRSGYGAILQTGRPRVRDPMRLMIFINLPNHSCRIRPWGLLSL
jgi:hypothetical protein